MKKLFSFFIIFSTMMVGLQARAKCLTDSINITIDEPDQLANCLSEAEHLLGMSDRHESVLAEASIAKKMASGFLINRVTLQGYESRSVCPAKSYRERYQDLEYSVLKNMTESKAIVANGQCLELEKFDLDFVLINPKDNQIESIHIKDGFTLAPGAKAN